MTAHSHSHSGSPWQRTFSNTFLGKRISTNRRWREEKCRRRAKVSPRILAKMKRGEFPSRPKSSFITLEQRIRSVFVVAVGWRPFYRLASPTEIGIATSLLLLPLAPALNQRLTRSNNSSPGSIRQRSRLNRNNWNRGKFSRSIPSPSTGSSITYLRGEQKEQ